MRKTIGKLTSFFCKSTIAVVAVSLGANIASAAPKGAYADKYAAIVIDANSGKTLFQENANAKRYPASLTKMMTLYMLFEAMQSGRISSNTPIPVSAYAASRPPTKIGFKAGQTIPAEIAARTLITRSANDVATAIAEYLGGSEARFGQMMTAKARRLGMMNTNFVNASGLPDPRNYTTARDMALLSLALREHFPRQYGWFSATSVNFRGKTINGHNRLVGAMKGVDGIKTGYTRMSGFNLATSMRVGNKSIVGVVMGGRSGPLRDQHMRELLLTYIDGGTGNRSAAPLVASRSFELPKGHEAPIPVARNNQVQPAAKVEVASVTDREHDAALLTALASRNAKLPPAIAAANDVVIESSPIKNPPKPVFKASFSKANAKDNTAVVEDVVASTINNDVIAVPQDDVIPVPDDLDTVITSSISNSKKGWVIQVGSKSTTAEANEALAQAGAAGRQALAGADPFLAVFDQGNERFYRARFSGFQSKTAAWQACNSLKDAGIACYALED
ncbi:D-alanyl-D-alanine carboxypeptidase [Bartonella sp. HY329]|uniref:D-alanyl-D-alanine carboxypeptidase n=1 Tax=unclassified Bartonella TaxID=2645622 RepID=UPI0021C8606B|nr:MULTISPECIES: D-alanyl-D-alanine carboxypeptidase [unclassified Bartonella]UXM94010.1 D-alanyl-D-alanine carboxypeptidase [Bartonella sp. HY329]UXN08332.1 D-alanyl-D-alanine carboxypeptidase [Bartonella sp. HY328]